MGRPKYDNEDELESYRPKEKNKRCSKAVKQYRLSRLTRMIAAGASQMDVVAYCGQEWGLSVRHSRQYYRDCIGLIKKEMEMDRQEFAAVLLMQVNDLQKKTAQRQNDSVTLGCINTAAKIARLFD